MKILAIHNFHRKGSASGDDQVFKSETALLESHGNQVIKYTVSNDEFDNAGLIGKLSATFGIGQTDTTMFTSLDIRSTINAYQL